MNDNPTCLEQINDESPECQIVASTLVFDECACATHGMIVTMSWSGDETWTWNLFMTPIN